MRLFCLFFLCPVMAWGQVSDTASQPAEITVEAQRFPFRGSTSPTAAQSEEELDRLAAAVTVKRMEDFAEGSDTNLAQSLSMIPGVYARSRNGSAQTRISIRGSGIARNADVRGIALQMNELPLNVADSDFDYLTAIEPLALSQIRVIRSANAEGSTGNNLGGSIDFVSYTGRTSNPGTVRAEFGSYGYYRQDGSGAWKTEHTDGYGSVDNLMLDGYREQSQQDRQHFDFNAAWREEGKWENRIYFTRVQSSEELPGALTQAQVIQNPRQAASSPIPVFNRKLADWKDQIEWNRVADKFNIQGSDQNLSGGVWFSYAQIRNPRNQIFDVNYHDMGGRLVWQKEMFPGDMEYSFSATLTPTYAWSSEPTYQNLLNGNRGALVDDNTKYWINDDLYLQNRLQITDKLSWIVSLQASYALRSIDGYIKPPGGSETNDTVDYFPISPATGLVFDQTPEIQWYGNLSRSAEPPTMGDLYQPGSANFAPQSMQTAITVEVGARGKHGPVGWEAAFYQSWLKNEFLISETFPGSGISITRNTPHSTHQGVEAGVNYEFLAQPEDGGVAADSLILATTFTWDNFFMENDPLYGDNRLPGLPEYAAQFELKYRNSCGAYIAPNLLLQPEGMFADYANTLRSDAFAVFGIRVGYEPKTGPQAFFEVQNLTGENYISDVSVIGNANGLDQRVFFPATGRAFYAGIAWKW